MGFGMMLSWIRWHHATGNAIFSAVTDRADRRFPLVVAVSPDGSRVAAGSANHRDIGGGRIHDTHIRVWTLSTGAQIAALPGGINGHLCVAFSPDGRTVAAGGADYTALWELATGTIRAKFVGHEGPVTAVAFAPDSRVLYTGSSDTTVLAWDLLAPAAEPIESGAHRQPGRPATNR
jgi:WD40 repeat protein